MSQVTRRDRDEKIRKIQKLLTHERSAREIGSTAEADAFAAKASELLRKYKLSMSDVELAKQRELEWARWMRDWKIKNAAWEAKKREGYQERVTYQRAVRAAARARENFETLRAAAKLMWPGAGAWACDSWAALNKHVFDGRLEFGGIIFGITPGAEKLGSYFPPNNVIWLCPSVLPEWAQGSFDPSKIGKLPPARAFWLDVLLHEMCHQAAHQFKRYQDGDNWHDSPGWHDTVKSINARVGLSGESQVSDWPHECRSPGWYKRRKDWSTERLIKEWQGLRTAKEEK